MDRGSSAAALPSAAAAGARLVASAAGRARLPPVGPARHDAVGRRGAATQDCARAGSGGQCEAAGPQALHPGRAHHRPALGRRADLVPRARPAGRRGAHGARDRAPPRRREACRLDHRHGAGCRRGRRSRCGPGHSRERRLRRRLRDRPVSAGPGLMGGNVLRVLIVEDSDTDAELMVRALRQAGFEPDHHRVETAAAMRAALDEPPGRPHREELDIIRDAATRAKDLIRQLLAFSARQVLQPAVVDLNRLVRDVAKMLRRLIGEDIKLETLLAPELGAVRVDAGQMEQVLVNLAVNARDAMPEGGRLTIKTDNVDAGGSQVLPHVSDSGVGMDEEVQAHLFEPFFTTKPRGKGSGLGLATVYGIVRQSGGHIAVDSAPGRGATFRVYLPRVEAPLDPTDRPRPVTAPAAGSETILLVEDEHLVRLLARKVLERAGYRVLVAAGGAEALELAERYAGPIHLLLTDVVMPGMNGRALMRRLAPLRPDLRVLYMSGYADEAVAQHGVLDPGTAFLQKPFTPGGLADKVRGVLDTLTA